VALQCHHPPAGGSRKGGSAEEVKKKTESWLKTFVVSVCVICYIE
jgi:hypothetical protein